MDGGGHWKSSETFSEKPLGVYGHVEVVEPLLHEQLVRPVEVLCTPLARRYHHVMTYLATPSILLYREEAGARLRGRGSLPPNRYSFCIPVRVPPGAMIGKRLLRDSGIPCSYGGALDITFAQGQIHFVLIVDENLIRNAFPPSSIQLLECAVEKLLLPASADAVARFADWLTEVLQAVQNRPRMLQFSDAVQALEAEVVMQLLDVIEHPPEQWLLDRPRARSLGLDRVLDWLHDRNLARVTSADLCRVASVSQRTLERAFRDTFEMSAREYLMAKRLRAVRQQLMSEQGQVRIGDIAHAHGFYELGRFAGYYSREFGERPSETLRSNRTSVESPLIFGDSIHHRP